MVFLWEVLTELVRCEQEWWSKNDDSVWRFTVAEDRLSKGIKIREGEGIVAARTKIMDELHINAAEESIELTYQMPSWMDINGSVKPVPITITTNDDLDLFLAMRMDIRELRLYVVPMPIGMKMELEDFRVIRPTHGFATMETVRVAEYERVEAVSGEVETEMQITLSQASHRKHAFIGQTSSQQETPGLICGGLSTDMWARDRDVHSGNSSSTSVFPASESSGEDEVIEGALHLTKDLLPLFDVEGVPTETPVFYRDASVGRRSSGRWITGCNNRFQRRVVVSSIRRILLGSEYSPSSSTVNTTKHDVKTRELRSV